MSEINNDVDLADALRKAFQAYDGLRPQKSENDDPVSEMFTTDAVPDFLRKGLKNKLFISVEASAGCQIRNLITPEFSSDRSKDFKIKRPFYLQVMISSWGNNNSLSETASIPSTVYIVCDKETGDFYRANFIHADTVSLISRESLTEENVYNHLVEWTTLYASAYPQLRDNLLATVSTETETPEQIPPKSFTEAFFTELTAYVHRVLCL